MQNIQFIQQDFQALEAKYPEGYWYLHSLALSRLLNEKEAKIVELSASKIVESP